MWIFVWRYLRKLRHVSISRRILPASPYAKSSSPPQPSYIGTSATCHLEFIYLRPPGPDLGHCGPYVGSSWSFSASLASLPQIAPTILNYVIKRYSHRLFDVNLTMFLLFVCIVKLCCFNLLTHHSAQTLHNRITPKPSPISL